MNPYLTRKRFALVLATSAFLPALANADSSRNIPCSVGQSGFGSAELACPLEPRQTPRILRFDASFAGVHDDSLAALGVQLDGEPVACSAGSRARLQGDAEGDALSCTIALPPAMAPRALRLQLVWHHAEPSGYTLRSD